MPRVTVGMIVYNGADHVARALDSVLAQTYADYEIVVVDDGSTDDTEAVLARYPCRVVRQTNAGTGAARAALVREARGDLIAFLDHDDEWMPEKLARQVPLHDDPKLVLSHTAAVWVNRDGAEETRRWEVEPGMTSFAQVLRGCHVFNSSAVFSRRAMVEGGSYDPELRRGSDWYGWIVLASKGTFRYLDETLIRYYRHEGQLSAIDFRFFATDVWMMEERILPKLPGWLAEETEADRRRYLAMFRQELRVRKLDLARAAKNEKKDRNLALKTYLEVAKSEPANPKYWLIYLKNLLFWNEKETLPAK